MNRRAVLAAAAFFFALAAMAAVPTPENHFGHPMGADRHLLEWSKVVSYFEEPTTPFNGLSEREWEVLSSLSNGLTYKEIAHQLSISLDTVRKHLGSIYRKLQVRSRTDAVRHYLQRPR